MTNAERREKSDKRIEKLIPLYYSMENNNTRAFLEEHNISNSVFYSYLKRHGLSSRRSSSRELFFNETYFDVIDTEEKAYWLGFLQCDGYISNRGIEISLAEVDYDHLVKLTKALNYRGKIGYRLVANKYGAYRINLISVRLVESFVKVGLEKFRSTTMEFLFTHDNPMFLHYVRGIIDANGSISLKQRKYGYSALIMLQSGSLKFLDKFKYEMDLYSNDANSVYVDSSRIRAILHRSAQNIIFNQSYKNAKISLDRKQAKVNAVLYGSAENI